MNYTVRTELRANKPDIKGKCPIAICITIGGKRAYKYTGIKVSPENWNGKVKNVPNHVLINAKINNERQAIEKELLARELKDEAITYNTVKSILSGKSDNSDYHAHAQIVLRELKQHRALGTYRRHKTESELLKEYAPNLTFADITPVFLTKYYKSMLDAGKDSNTARAAFKHIMRVFNHAKDTGVTTLYPFTNWKLPKYNEKPREYLTKSELEQIQGLLKKELDPTMRSVIAYYLLECYAGIRHSDWGKYKVEKMLEGENLTLRTTKTGTRVTIPLDHYPSLKWIVDYIRDNKLSFDLSLQKTNVYLKAIANMADITKKLTTHIGRHTFAVLMLEKGFSKELIAELMGVTLKVVNTYAKYTTGKARSEFERLGGI